MATKHTLVTLSEGQRSLASHTEVISEREAAMYKYTALQSPASSMATVQRPLRTLENPLHFVHSLRPRPPAASAAAGSPSARFCCHDGNGSSELPPGPASWGSDEDQDGEDSEAALPLVGRGRGIQGHKDSSFLDALLVAMFARPDSPFLPALERPRRPGDAEKFCAIQNCLRCEIVPDLREANFVPAGKVLKLRRYLGSFDVIPEMKSGEADPALCLDLLLGRALGHRPLVLLSCGRACYQLALKRAGLDAVAEIVPPATAAAASDPLSVRQLLDCEFLLHWTLPGAPLLQPPAALVLRTEPDTVPLPALDIAHLLAGRPRPCAVCGRLAALECRRCLMEGRGGGDLRRRGFAFCRACFDAEQAHSGLDDHRPAAEIRYPPEVERHYAGGLRVPTCAGSRMQLWAAICRQRSRYLCLLRWRRGRWLLFDSTAKSGTAAFGFAVPEVTDLGHLDPWLDPGKLAECKVVPKAVHQLTRESCLLFYQPDRLQHRLQQRQL